MSFPSAPSPFHDQCAITRARSIPERDVLYFHRMLGVLITMGAGSLAGFFGVLIASHLYPPAALGLASVALAGAPFVNVFANLGLIPTVLRRLARSPEPAHLLGAAYGIGGVATLVGAAAYSLLVPLGSDGGASGAGFAARAAFVALALGMFLHSVQDSALFALNLAGRAAARTIATQICRIGLLVVLVHVSEAGIVIAAAASYLTVTIWVQWRVLGPRVGRIRLSFSAWRTLLDRNLSYLSASYLLDILAWLPPALLPVLVGHYISMRAAGLYYVASLVFGVAMLPVGAIATAETAGQSAVHEVSTVQRGTLLLTLAVGITVTVALAGVGPLALGVFGAVYRVHTTVLLRLLAITVVPASFRHIYITRARLQLAMCPPLFVTGVSASSVIVLTLLLLPRYGLIGIGVAACVAEWLAAGLAGILWWFPTHNSNASSPLDVLRTQSRHGSIRASVRMISHD